MSIYFVLFWGALLLAAVGAQRWGGWPERLTAALYLLAALSSVVVSPRLSTKYGDVELAVFLIDLMLLLGLIAIAARSDRWWPLFASAFQALAVLAHVGRAVNPHLLRYGYQLMAVWSALPTVICLLVGVAFQRRRKATAAISNGSSARRGSTDRT